MLALILMATLAQSPGVQVNANLFEPKELSAEYLFFSMQICFQSEPGFPSNNVAFCGCVTDAMRANTRKNLHDTTPTTEQRKRCSDTYRPKAPAPKPKPKGGK